MPQTLSRDKRLRRAKQWIEQYTGEHIVKAYKKRFGVIRLAGGTMDYISVQEAAKKWGLSERRVQKLCEENRIPSVVHFCRMWLIPKDAVKPVDGRYKSSQEKK